LQRVTLGRKKDRHRVGLVGEKEYGVLFLIKRVDNVLMPHFKKKRSLAIRARY
jgi:hypothetical protein